MFKRLLLPFLIAFAIFHINSSLAQSNKDKERVKQKIWGTKDPDFEVKEVKKEWSDKSAVILSKSMVYEVRKEVFVSQVLENMYLRVRLKLLDKAAVEKFSERTFSEGKTVQYGFARYGSRFYFGIKVIKPNGKEKEVDLGDAVEKEIQSDGNQWEYKKVAIKDLEVGDIIDYYYAVESTILDNVFEPFDMVNYSLIDDYPLMKHKVSLRIMRKCYLSAKSLNGAPELKQSIDNNGDPAYTLAVENKEEVGDLLWFYPKRELPTLKFQAFYVTGKGIRNYPKYALFLGDGKSIKKEIPKTVILKYINEHVTKIKGDWISLIIEHNAKNKKKETDPEEYAREAYNYLRQRLYMTAFERRYLKNAEHSPELGNYWFVGIMSKVLTKKKINHDIIVTIPNNSSGIEDLLLYEEIRLAIRVNTPTPFYLSGVSIQSHYNDLSHLFQGNKSYAVNINTKKKHRSVKEISIPQDEPSRNKERNEFIISLNKNDLTKADLIKTSSYTGSQRTENINLLTPFDFIEDSRAEKYGIMRVADENLKKKEKDLLLGKVDDLKRQDNERRLKAIKEVLENTMAIKIDSLEKMELIQTGLWPDKPELKYSTHFTAKEIANKVGQNYLLHVGKLIGAQVKIEEKNRLRNFDIYCYYPRTFENQIIIKIPEGYRVKGLDKLKYTINNSTGGFTSNAELKNNETELHITAKKYYNHNYEDRKNWPLMLTFLDASFEFSQQKILLEKK